MCHPGQLHAYATSQSFSMTPSMEFAFILNYYKFLLTKAARLAYAAFFGGRYGRAQSNLAAVGRAVVLCLPGNNRLQDRNT